MGRPRTPIGTFGDITYVKMPGGRVRARTRYRDDDGQIRRVSATGSSNKDALRALKASLAQRPSHLSTGEITGDSSFAKLVEVWLEDLDMTNKLAPSTRSLYERNMRQLVMPAFEHYVLREITVRKVDTFIKTLATTKSYSMAKQARTVLSLALGLAVRYGAIAKNPVRDTGRLHKPPTQATSLSETQVEKIRASARGWRHGPGFSGPPPDGQLEQIIEVMLGTSARIGEVLAIRKCDVDATSDPATVRICGTIVSPTGKPTQRQPHPKTMKSTRTVSVPSFAAEVLRDRLVKVASEDHEHLVFVTRNGTPLTTNNVRRRLRAVLEEAGIEGVTPHSFRRTVATVLDRAGWADLAAEMLGHTSSKITTEHYIEHDDKVNPVTAEILESLARGTAMTDRYACAIPYLFDTLEHMNVRDRVLERAAEQHGYITTRDARELGVDPTQLRLMAARGRLERIGRGVYRVPMLPRTEHDELAEAVAWTLGRGVISHESALVLYGLSDVSPSRIHLTVPRANHPRAAGGEMYRLHRRDLDHAEVTEHDGIPVTTASRTIRDCLADGTDPYQLRLAVDEAEAQGRLRRAEAEGLRGLIDARSAAGTPRRA